MAVRALTIVAVAAAAVAVACAPVDSGPAVARTDDNGVEIVTATRPAWEHGGQWEVAAAPDVVIGENTDELEYLFSSVAGVVALPDGRIVAGDYDTRELRFFDREGRFLQAVGREGQGPGELGVLAQVLRCGAETMVVIDGMRYEVNQVSPAGEFGRRDLLEVNAGVSLLFPFYCNADGLLMASDFGDQLRGPRQTGFHRGSAHVWLLDPQGFPLRDFGEFAGVELFEFNGRTSRHPFGKRMALSLGNDHAYIGTADDFEIEVWSFDGELVRRIRRPFTDATVAAADLERHIELEAATLPFDRVEEYRARSAAMPVPDTYPAYEMFVLDHQENLWVQHFPRVEATQDTWSVFDATGVWLGELSLAGGLFVTDIGADYVLGFFRDDLGEQSIRRYALRR